MRLPDFAFLSSESPRFLPGIFCFFGKTTRFWAMLTRLVINPQYILYNYYLLLHLTPLSIYNMSHGRIDFGVYLHELRTKRNLSQKKVADKLQIDISLLSKIEHGERQIQGHMLKPLAELFKLNYKNLQMEYLNQRIEDVFGDEPFFNETIIELASTRNK